MNKFRIKMLLMGAFIAATTTNALAQFDPTTEVTTASTSMGTIFGVIFTAILGIVLGKKALSWLRSS